MLVTLPESTRLGICSLWQRAREHVAPARGGRVGHTELEVSDGAVGEAAASAVRVLQRSDSGDCAKVVDQLLHIATVGTDRTVARVPVNRPLSTVIADAGAAAGVERGRRGHINRRGRCFARVWVVRMVWMMVVRRMPVWDVRMVRMVRMMAVRPMPVWGVRMVRMVRMMVVRRMPVWGVRMMRMMAVRAFAFAFAFTFAFGQPSPLLRSIGRSSCSRQFWVEHKGGGERA